jgi:hypothetical protein
VLLIYYKLKRLWNGSKKAGIKVGEHFAENNVWAKGAIAKRCCVCEALASLRASAQIAFREGVSEDGK